MLERPTVIAESHVAKLADTPEAKLADTPEAKLADTPEAKLADAPEAKLTDAPEAKLTKTPEAKLTKTPDGLVQLWLAEIAEGLTKNQKLELIRVILDRESEIEKRRTNTTTGRFAVAGGIFLSFTGVVGGVTIGLLATRPDIVALGAFGCAIMLGATIIGYGLTIARGGMLNAKDVTEAIHAIRSTPEELGSLPKGLGGRK